MQMRRAISQSGRRIEQSCERFIERDSTQLALNESRTKTTVGDFQLIARAVTMPDFGSQDQTIAVREARFAINRNVARAAALYERDLSEVVIVRAVPIAVKKREVDPDGFINAPKNSLAGEMLTTSISHDLAV
jgi:hypothetical protein